MTEQANPTLRYGDDSSPVQLREMDIPVLQDALLEEMKRRQVRLEGDGFNLMVAAIELEPLEAIRDLYGETIAARFLAAVNGRLRNVLDSDGHVAYLGQGRLIVLSKARPAGRAEAIDAMRFLLRTALTGRFGLEGPVIDYDSPSVGVIAAATSANRPETLLSQAFISMHAARQRV